MANDFGIRIIMDEGGAGGMPSDQVPEVVRKVIQLLESETLAITNAAAYVDGSRVYNVTLSLNTIVAADYSIEILIDSTVSTNKKVELLCRLLQSLATYTLTLVLATTYSAGTSDTSQVSITVT